MSPAFRVIISLRCSAPQWVGRVSYSPRAWGRGKCTDRRRRVQEGKRTRFLPLIWNGRCGNAGCVAMSGPSAGPLSQKRPFPVAILMSFGVSYSLSLSRRCESYDSQMTAAAGDAKMPSCHSTPVLSSPAAACNRAIHDSTGCPTVSVTTLIAYFSDICDYFRISF